MAKVPRHGESFDAALEAKLAARRAQGKREAAAATAARALRERAGQTLPTRQAAAEAAAATMRADARKTAQILRGGGGQMPAKGKLEAKSSISDPSRKVVGYENQKRRLLLPPKLVFKPDHEQIDVWLITASEFSHSDAGSGDGPTITWSHITGVGLTAGGNLVTYTRSSSGWGAPKSAHIPGAPVLINGYPVITNGHLAPIEYARDDGSYDTSIIETWRSKLLDTL